MLAACKPCMPVFCIGCTGCTGVYVWYLLSLQAIEEFCTGHQLFKDFEILKQVWRVRRSCVTLGACRAVVVHRPFVSQK